MQKAHDSSYNDYWRNYPNIGTPIVQDQLNRMETTMDTIDDRVVTFDTTKANQTDLLADIKNVSFDSSTGTFTFTKQNNTTIVIDTDIEKIAVNFDYDDDPESAHYQSLIITLDDGTVKYVDMSALITEYEFTDSAVIHFTITNGVISANVINGSITAEKLQPNFLADCVSAKEGAETAETNAETAETNALAHQYTAEAWAKGTKNGVPVTPTDEQYHDNAYYWAQQARSIVGDKVDSFNGRTGTVVAEDGDYESGMIVPEAGAISGQVPVVRNVGTGQEVKLRYVNEDLDIGLKPHIIVISETGSTVTLTKGTKVIYADETSPEHFEADVTEFGTWVIDSILSGDDAQVSLVVDAVKIYTVDDSHWHADITVTYPTGGTCSCSKSGTTTLYATGSPYTFTVHESGTYTITATANGETYTTDVEITTSGQTESLTIPEGSTITPTDSVATLLSCAGIHDTSITSVSDLLADTTTLLAVINSNNAIDYLVRSTTFATDITADSTAMSYIGLNNYASDTLLGSNNPNLVPIMTSNTTPSGVAFSEQVTRSGYEAYRAFDGSDSTDVRSNTDIVNHDVAYDFTTSKKVSFASYLISYYISIKIQYSDNGTTWTDASDTITITSANQQSGTIAINSNVGEHRYWRFYGSQASGGAGYIFSIKFYGKDYAPEIWLNAICNSTYFESVLNVKVPVMTSNTTPSGVASANVSYDSNYPAYKAFDGNDTSRWLSTDTSSAAWVKYEFPQATKCYYARIKPSLMSDNSCMVKAYVLQGSNDDFTSDIQQLYTETLSNQNQDVYRVLNNINSYKYYRIYITSAYSSNNRKGLGTLQFYGREDV